MRQSFGVHDGTVDVVVDEASRTVGIYRFDAQHRNVAATMESWDHVDLADALVRRVGVSSEEALYIADEVRSLHADMGAPPPEPEVFDEIHRLATPLQLDPAGVALRFVAVLLDTIIVFFPLSILVGILTGGAYSESGPGYANAGVTVGGKGILVWLALVLGYYVFCEAIAGRTLGKRLIRIRVVDEDGDAIGLSAAVVRNLLRAVDGLFIYLVGAIFAWTSPLGQRLGDRAASTVVVRG